MKILETKFVQGFIKMANDGYLQGWHERNGGNLSYRLKAEEVEMALCRILTGASGQLGYDELTAYRADRKSTRLNSSHRT